VGLAKAVLGYTAAVFLKMLICEVKYRRCQTLNKATFQRSFRSEVKAKRESKLGVR